MPKEANPTAWEFAKYALQRNDEAIRFSETKAALLLTLTGLLLGIMADKITLFKNLLLSPSCATKILATSSMMAISVGIILVAIASLVAVFPRLRVAKDTSYLYFEHLAGLSEQDTASQFAALDSNTKLQHILSQVHATSAIATRKFRLIRFALVGTVLVLIGSILAILALFIN